MECFLHEEGVVGGRGGVSCMRGCEDECGGKGYGMVCIALLGEIKLLSRRANCMALSLFVAWSGFGIGAWALGVVCGAIALWSLSRND